MAKPTPTPHVPLHEGFPSHPESALAKRPAHRGTLLAGENQAIAFSFAGAAMCLGAGVTLAAGAPMAVAAILFPLGAACDLIDGKVARRAERRSHPKRGAVIDSLCDKLGEAGLLLGLGIAVGDITSIYLLFAAFALGTLASYSKSVACEHDLKLSWPEVRIFGRAGRAVLISLILVAAIFMEENRSVLIVGFGTLLAFNGATCVWRMNRIARTLLRSPG